MRALTKPFQFAIDKRISNMLARDLHMRCMNRKQRGEEGQSFCIDDAPAGHNADRRLISFFFFLIHITKLSRKRHLT